MLLGFENPATPMSVSKQYTVHDDIEIVSYNCQPLSLNFKLVTYLIFMSMYVMLMAVLSTGSTIGISTMRKLID